MNFAPRCEGCVPDPVTFADATPLMVTPEHSTSLAAALGYVARRGWKVFPVPPNTKKSYKSAEHSDGAKWGMTNDAEEIRRDHARWPDAGVGIPTGGINGFFVVEADTKEGHDVDGIAKLRELEEQRGKLPTTLMAISPSGSLHYYFRHPGSDAQIKNSSSELAPGVDVRGDGGMVVAPPTKRHDGQYRWLNELEIAEPPQWLHDLVIRRSTNAHDRAETGTTDSTLITMALSVIPNDELDWENWNRIGMATWAATGGSDAGFDAFDEWSKKSNKYDAETTRERWNAYSTSPPNQIGAGTLFFLANQEMPNWRGDPLTDLGNAKRLVRLHGKDLRHVHAWNSWIIWKDGHWRRDDDGAAMRMAKETVEKMFTDAAAINDETRRTALRNHALRSQSAQRLTAMVKLAETEADVVLSATKLDADHHLLGVKNGIVDLRRVEFRAARQEDNVTRIAGPAFDADARCPNWAAFLRRIMPSEEVRKYLQRVVGYSMTGLTSEEVIFAIYGEGSTGKST
jgi:hypothetical protein